MGFFGDLWDDISDIPDDIIDGLKIAAFGPVGVVVIDEAILVGTPDIIIQGVVFGPNIHPPLKPRTRRMSSEEHWLAKMVYGNSLPFHKIVLTDVVGMGGRWFVIPNVVGEILVNIGESFEDPLRYTSATYPEFGQVLMHELGHAWQIRHSGSIDFLIEAVPPQITGPEYDPGDGRKPWNEYSIEQQAAIVDVWYSGVNGYAGGTSIGKPCSRGNPFYNHVRDTINGGNEPPVLQTLSVRGVARSKFDEIGAFSVSSMFPRQNSGSLRRRLIGLKS